MTFLFPANGLQRSSENTPQLAMGMNHQPRLLAAEGAQVTISMICFNKSIGIGPGLKFLTLPLVFIAVTISICLRIFFFSYSLPVSPSLSI